LERRRCAGTNSRGEPCRSTIVLESGYCRGHDPAYAEARRRSAARNGTPARDPELGEIREGLARLTERVDAGDVDTERIDLLVRISRARVYAIKIDSEVARHAAEIRKLEDAYDRLLSDYEALRDGKPTSTGPGGWYLRKGANG
jgi:hypothetical protein